MKIDLSSLVPHSEFLKNASTYLKTVEEKQTPIVLVKNNQVRVAVVPVDQLAQTESLLGETGQSPPPFSTAVIGTTDVRSFDPTAPNPNSDVLSWKESESSFNLRTPIGWQRIGDSFTAFNPVYLDLAEASLDGDGPHGCIQGMTGSGKSTLLSSLVLSLACRYSPDRVNFALLDFKGGATFSCVKKLPHTVVRLSRLEAYSERVEWVIKYLDDEARRREHLLREHAARDIIDYRKMSLRAPVAHPPLPELVVIMDEFREYAVGHGDHMKQLSRYTAIGRALGIHMLFSSQFIDVSVMRDAMEHMTFGISLRVSTDAYSRVVIGNTDAARLPSVGEALMRGGNHDTVTRFTVLNGDVPLSGERESAPRVTEQSALVDRIVETAEGKYVNRKVDLPPGFDDDDGDDGLAPVPAKI